MRFESLFWLINNNIWCGSCYFSINCYTLISHLLSTTIYTFNINFLSFFTTILLPSITFITKPLPSSTFPPTSRFLDEKPLILLTLLPYSILLFHAGPLFTFYSILFNLIFYIVTSLAKLWLYNRRKVSPSLLRSLDKHILNRYFIKRWCFFGYIYTIK